MKRNAVLLELLLVIVVFALASAVLLRLINAAYSTSEMSRLQSLAAIAAQDMAETLKADEARLEALAQSGEAESVSWFDATFSPVEDGGENCLALTVNALDGGAIGAGVVYDITIIARTAEGRELFKLNTAEYFPNKGGGAR